MAARTRPGGEPRRAADRDLGKDRDAAIVAQARQHAQVLTDDGHRLPPRRVEVIGAPGLARPGWYGQTELNYNYFAADLLPRYLQENAATAGRWRIHYKARGTLQEPHTGVKVPLGTAEVEDYRFRWTNGVDLGDPSFCMPVWGQA